MNILNLPNWKVIEQEERERDYRIVVEGLVSNRYCLHCHSRAISRNGTRSAHFVDIPLHGKSVLIEVIRQRYICKDCGKTSSQYLPDLDDKRDATVRLVQYVREQSLKRTFVNIAEEVGIAPNTVRNIFEEYTLSLDLSHKPEAPEWLGISEIYAVRRPRCVLTNVKDRLLLDIIPSRNKPAVARRLANLPDRGSVKLVTIDMWPGYRDAAKHYLPQAKIMVDKFHIVRLAYKGLDLARKSVREGLSAKRRRVLVKDRSILLRRHHELKDSEKINLEAWTKKFPLLGEAYALKEGLYDIYNSRDRYEARERCRAWLTSVPKPLRPAFKELISAVCEWEEHILAYFDQNPSITDAYTDSVNRLLRHVRRNGRGYSFDALRAKLLYTAGVRKYKRHVYERNGRGEAEKTYHVGFRHTPNSFVGADISTLLDEYESGEL